MRGYSARRRRVARLVVALVALSALTPTFGRAGPVEAAIAYYTGTGVKVANLDGDELATFGLFDFISLDGNVFAGSRNYSQNDGEFVRVVDLAAGEEFRIHDAFAPVMLAGGRKVGFLPDRFAHRDPYFSSIWIRNEQGKERRVVQFTGPKRTIAKTGFQGEGIPLDFAWDELGRKLAVTYGNDVDLFIYDVWLIDVRTREGHRLTKGKVSRFPSLSPSGERVALLREVDKCGGPDPGYRAGDIKTMLATGADKKSLIEGSCELFYTDPRWISENELVAARLTKVTAGEYTVDLVQIDATTSAVTELVTGGDIVFFTVSSALQKIAFVRDGVSGFSTYDLATGQITQYPDGFLPHLSGAHRFV